MARPADATPDARATLGADGVLLLDHPALAELCDCQAVTAYIVVTPLGREWLCFRDVPVRRKASCSCCPIPTISRRRGPK